MEERDKFRYFIGQTLFEEGFVPPDGMYYQYRDREHLLVLISRNITAMPTRATLLFGPAEFAITVQENILFFLARFGHYHWRAAPYYWYLIPESERNLPQEAEMNDGGCVLRVLLVDRALRSVQGIRNIVLSSDFTAELHHSISQQITLPCMETKDYHEALVRVRERYSRPKDLVSVAKTRYLDNPQPPPWRTSKVASENQM